MKSLNEYIKLVEDGPMTAAVNQQLQRGAQTKAQTAQQHPLEIGATRTAPPATVDPAAFPQGALQPSSDPMGFKSAAASDPLKAVFPATQGTASQTAATSAIKPTGATKTQGASTTPARSGTPKPAFKDLGSQYGYNSPAEVQAIQQQLLSMGYDLGPTGVDGKFGPKTQAAYKQAYSQMYGQQPGQTDPNAPVPQNYQQGRVAKQDLSKDMAAAVGVPNPYATAPASAPSQQKQDLLAKAAELTKAGDTAKAKIYTDAAVRMKESVELDRIKNLINYK